MIRFFASGLLSLALLTGPARAAGHFATVPHTPDPAAYYLFYLHGTFLEKHPDGTPHPRSGTPYDWSGIVKSFVERGFTVISEVRSSGTRSRNYADKIKDQITKLLAGGVAPQRITVAGHSKGGSIALHTAAIAQNPELNFINLAGCGDRGRFARNFRWFLASPVRGLPAGCCRYTTATTELPDPARQSETPVQKSNFPRKC